MMFQPPSGGCVLKHQVFVQNLSVVGPAAFGRLCVETLIKLIDMNERITSRLRAAVC